VPCCGRLAGGGQCASDGIYMWTQLAICRFKAKLQLSSNILSYCPAAMDETIPIELLFFGVGCSKLLSPYARISVCLPCLTLCAIGVL